MTSRTLAGVVTYAIVIVLAFLALPRNPDEPARPQLFIAAAVVFLVLTLLRDRYLSRVNVKPSSSQLQVLDWLRKPWTAAVLCTTLVFTPIAILHELGADRISPALGAMAELYPYWTALLTTLALLWMQLPPVSGMRAIVAVIPAAYLLLLAIAAIDVLPGMVFLVVTGGDSYQGAASAAPVTLTVAAFSWVAYRYSRAA